MDLFWKSTAAVIITVILCLSLGKWENGITILLTIAVCCMLGIISASFLSPVIDLLGQLEILSNLDNHILKILLKILGISFISEITYMICTDSGNSSLGKMITFLSSCVILWLSIPIVNQFIDLLKRILGAL